MRIPGELLSSPWIYRASMAVLWSWLLTVILSLVLTAIAKRIAFVISQRENKGALKTASVGLVRVSIFVDWLTSFGKKPIVLLSFDSVQLHFRVPGEFGFNESHPPIGHMCLSVTLAASRYPIAFSSFNHSIISY